MSSNSNLDIGPFVDAHELKALARDLRAASPLMYKEFRQEMKAAGAVVAAEAKRRAGVFSKRIPGSIKVSVTSLGTSVTVKAGGAKAPDASPIENSGRGFVRHPVFGNRNAWTAKGSHPAYLAPSVDAKAEEVTNAIANVVDATFKGVGFDL